jgi:hypothetical protein
VDQIVLVPNILSKEQCAQMIVDAKFDIPVKRDAPFEYKDYNLLQRRRMKEHPLVLELTSLFQWNVDSAPIIWYPAGTSNSMHADNSINENGDVIKMTEWTRSVIIFLNEEFHGGELIYPEQGLIVKPKTGTMLIAPAGIDYPHYVTATDSDRYVLVLRLI